MPRPPTPKAEREMERSFADRVSWEPGDPHKHDVLFEEAQAARDAITPALETFLATLEHIERLLTTIVHRETQTEADALPAAEASVQQMIEQRFKSRRHYDHLSALFAILRRQNVLGRLHVAQAALELAQALLEDQDTIWQDFLQAINVTEAQLREQIVTEEQKAPEKLETSSEKGEEQEHENIRGARGPLKPLIGSVDQARRHLRTFEQRLPELRSSLLQRTGRIEVFTLWKKTSFYPEVLTLRKAIRRAEHAGISLDQIDPKLIATVHPQVAAHFLEKGLHVPLPKHLEREAYRFQEFGPYGKLRIKGITATKGTRKGPNYAISFGPRDRTPGYVLQHYFS